jgi:hypothetical protein
MRTVTFSFFLIVFAFFYVPSVRAEENNLMPQPAEITWETGRLIIDGNFHLALDGYREPRLEAAARRFIR